MSLQDGTSPVTSCQSTFRGPGGRSGDVPGVLEKNLAHGFTTHYAILPYTYIYKELIVFSRSNAISFSVMSLSSSVLGILIKIR